MAKAIYILPVQTDRGVFLHITHDGKALPPVGPLNDEYAMFVPLEEEAVVVDEDDRKKSSAKRQRKRAIRQEDGIARDINGRRQVASGALPNRKGDAYKEGKIRVEAKYTNAASYRLELSTLFKIASESKAGEVPTVVVEFLDKASSTTIEKFAIVYYADWKRLVNGSSDGDDSGLPEGK